MTREEINHQRWLKTHRINENGIIERQCGTCKEWKIESESNFYYLNRKTSERSFQSECKYCSKNRALNNRHSNLERARKSKQKWYREGNNVQKVKEYNREYYETDPEKKLNIAREFRENHPDRLAIYNKNRRDHKTHKITNNEWMQCKTYFNNCCAYCGLHQNEHMIRRKGKLVNFDLHKEHVIHNGSNGIDNCVPSCQSCNSEKHIFTLDEWYNEQNIKYTQERYDKVVKWLSEDYKVVDEK